MPTLSIFSTFKEVLFLGLKNFWFLVAVTCLTHIPNVFMEMYPFPIKHSFSLPLFLYANVTFIAPVILIAANTASILGCLKRDPTQRTILGPAWQSVRAYTWTLFRVSLLLVCVAIVCALPFGLIMRVFGVSTFTIWLLTVFYLVFAKYALADPLVVLENMTARAALQRSWKMTKGHFGYVAGCYILLGGLQWLLHTLLSSPLDDASKQTFTYFMVRLYLDCADSLWIILAWVMYQRIKEADSQPPPFPSAKVEFRTED
jgi:hypothetical protein